MGRAADPSRLAAPGAVGLHGRQETLSRDELAALQLERLRATLRNARG